MGFKQSFGRFFGKFGFFKLFLFFVVATYLLFVLLYFEVVRIELRVSCLLGKFFPTDSHLTHGRHHIDF